MIVVKFLGLFIIVGVMGIGATLYYKIDQLEKEILSETNGLDKKQ